MRPVVFIMLPMLVAALISCTKLAPPAFGEPTPMSLPAGSDTIGPRLSAAPDGTVLVSWMQRDASGARLRYSTLTLGKWQAPLDVVSDPKMFVNWADLPSVLPLDDANWVAHWLSKSAAAAYAYDVLLVQSSDGGRSWGTPVRPHSDGTPTEHGFVSIHPEGDAAALLWLDGRHTGGDVGEDSGAGGMTLRSAVVRPDGTVSREQLVDDRVCDCCQTDVAVGRDGPVGVYRDRSADEIRDIYVTRLIDGQWTPGVPVADDGWEISGCPVNGPAIDAAGELVAVAWFSAANDRPVVRAAISTNAGRTFRDAVEIASAGASGHVGIAIIDRNSVAVSWVESDRRGTHAIRIRALTKSGELGPPSTVGRSKLQRIYPQLVRSKDKLILAWTDEVTEASEIVSIEVPILGFYEG